MFDAYFGVLVQRGDQMIRRLALTGLAFAASTAAVEAETLRFSGTAVGACALSAPVDGTLALGANLSSWSTVTAASLTAVNTAPATLTVTKPTNWASSPAGTPATTFTITSAISGTNVGTLTGSGSAQSGALTALGTNTLSVSLAASAASAYHTGLHTAEVTVTCSVP